MLVLGNVSESLRGANKDGCKISHTCSVFQMEFFFINMPMGNAKEKLESWRYDYNEYSLLAC